MGVDTKFKRIGAAKRFYLVYYFLFLNYESLIIAFQINILFSFGYLHEKSGLVRSGGLTMFNAFKRMFQPGV